MSKSEQTMHMTKWAFCVLCGAAALPGCASTGSDASTGDQSALQLAIGMSQSADVASIQFRVTPVDCKTGSPTGPAKVVVRDLEDGTIPGGAGALDNHPLDDGSAHFFADLFLTVPAGCYDVEANPLTASGAPSSACASAVNHGVLVKEAKTTETFLLNQCHGKDPGNLDAIAALNFPPTITDVSFQDSKFGTCNQDEVVCATAVDPDGDPLEFKWTIDPKVASQVTGPKVISTTQDDTTGAVTQCVSFNASQPGKFPIDLKVYDQLWQHGHLVRIEDFLTAAGYPNPSHATNDFFFFAINCGCATNTDVVLFPDVSGSAADDLPIIKASAGALFDALVAAAPDAHFGVASFVDKPISPLGGPGDYVFQIATGGQITDNRTTFVNAVQSLALGNGADAPQSQLESLMQLANHASDLGYRSTAQRFAILTTDAGFHVPGDCTACTHANNGDGVIDPLEDYASVAQLATALVAANIAPVFAVTADQVATYEQLTHDLEALGVKPGKVVTLASDSSNIVDAVLSGLSCPGH